MTTIPVEPGGPEVDPSQPYAGNDDVLDLLGAIRTRLPSWLDVDAQLRSAHARVVELLGRTYPQGVPTFDGDGLTVVRFAEAKLAAAQVYDVLRANLAADQLEIAAGFTASAVADLDGGVVGYPIPAVPPPSDDVTAPIDRPSNYGPRVSSTTPLSVFPDPYEDAPDVGRFR